MKAKQSDDKTDTDKPLSLRDRLAQHVLYRELVRKTEVPIAAINPALQAKIEVLQQKGPKTAGLDGLLLYAYGSLAEEQEYLRLDIRAARTTMPSAMVRLKKLTPAVETMQKLAKVATGIAGLLRVPQGVSKSTRRQQTGRSQRTPRVRKAK